MPGLSIISSPTTALKPLVSATSNIGSANAGGATRASVINSLTNRATVSVLSSASPTTGALIGAGVSLATGRATGKTIALAAASAVGLNMNMSPKDAINTLAPGATQAISGAISGALAGSLSGLAGFKIDFPSFQIPGLGQISMLIAAGKKFIAEQLLKLKTIVPPFAPGLKINMAMVSAALSLIKAAMSGNLGAIAKSLLEDVLEDLKESSGFNDVMENVQDQIDAISGEIGKLESAVGKVAQVAGMVGAVSGIIGGAKSSYVDNYNKQNPPKTTYDEDGNAIVEQPPPPDTGVFDQADSIFGTNTETSGSTAQSGSMASTQTTGSIGANANQPQGMTTTGGTETAGTAGTAGTVGTTGEKPAPVNPVAVQTLTNGVGNIVTSQTPSNKVGLSVSQANALLTGNQSGVRTGTVNTIS